MPKLVLKHFVDSKGRSYAYDFAANRIIYSTPTAINTEIDYYSKEAEAYLSKNIETPFGQVLSKLLSVKEGETINLSDAEEEYIRGYVYSLFSRDMQMLEDVKKYSRMWEFIDEQAKHDYSAIIGAIVAKEKKILSGFELTILKNISDIPFLLPTCGIYTYQMENGEYFAIVPISEDIAIVLFEKSRSYKYKIKDGICLMVAQKKMEFLNNQAFLSQKQRGYGFLVSSNKNILEALIDNYKTMQNKQ